MFVQIESPAVEKDSPTLGFRVLSSWFERLVGLLGTGPSTQPVVLMRCGSIHTYGMAYPIDVALVGSRGEVLASERALPPCRVFSHAAAFCAFERPASPCLWPIVGETLRVTSLLFEPERSAQPCAALPSTVWQPCGRPLWSVEKDFYGAALPISAFFIDHCEVGPVFPQVAENEILRYR